MACYLVLGALSVLCGLGIQRLLRLPFLGLSSIFLAPVVALAFWSLALTGPVLWGYTIAQATPVIWTLTLLLAVAGLTRAMVREVAAHPLQVAELFILPMLLLAPYFIHGIKTFPGSWFWDGPYYVRDALYLWHYPLHAAGELAPVYRIAQWAQTPRVVGPALLDFFSPLTESGDPQTSTGLYLAWSVFVYAASVAYFFGRKFQPSYPRLGGLYVGLAVFSGWILNVVIANNYENLTFLPILPALCGLDYAPQTRRVAQAVLCAMLCAAGVFLYVELTPLLLMVMAAMWLEAMCGGKDKRRRALVLLLLVVAGAAIIILPRTRSLATYVQWSFHRSDLHGGSEDRPGSGFFPGLVESHGAWATYWGFAAPYHRPTWSEISTVLSVVLTAAAAVGLYVLVKIRAYGLLALACLSALAAADMALVSHYDYGTYKLIVSSWWLMSLLAIIGLDFISQRLRPRGFARTAILVPILAVVGVVVVARIGRFSKSVTPRSMAIYRRVEAIAPITQGQVIIVTIDDPMANQWALYYLRDLPLYLVGGRGAYYSPDTLMQGVRSVAQADARYILTDNPRALDEPPLWTSAPFYLWPLKDAQRETLPRPRRAP